MERLIYLTVLSADTPALARVAYVRSDWGYPMLNMAGPRWLQWAHCRAQLSPVDGSNSGKECSRKGKCCTAVSQVRKISDTYSPEDTKAID